MSWDQNRRSGLLILTLSVSLSACVETPPSTGRADASTGSESPAPPTQGSGSAPTASQYFELSDDEEIREQHASAGAGALDWDLESITPVFVTYVVCEPGADFQLFLVDAVGEKHHVPVTCDGVVNRETTIHDPTRFRYDALGARVAGEGRWAVALAASTVDINHLTGDS